jgi:hypothetical protein
MGRSPCCDENGLKKGPWTTEEDEKLMEYIQKNGHGSWRALPKLAGMCTCTTDGVRSFDLVASIDPNAAIARWPWR